jgi:hypothetical protein
MKKSKKLKKLAKANIKVLQSGKIKVTKGEKISIKPFVKESVDNVIMSRLDGIISKEDVVVDTENLRCDKATNMIDEMQILDLTSKVSSATTKTIVVSMTKKNVLNAFDYLVCDTIGILLRTSTLASIYTSIKEAWVELNKDDATNFTNVLFIPKIMVFIDFNTGKIRKTPLYVNLLVVATPPVNKMSSDGVEEISDEMAASRVIADIVESVIKCGAKNIILNPYCNKILQKDKNMVSNLWNQVTTGQRVLEQINSIDYSLENEEDFIVFTAAAKAVV